MKLRLMIAAMLVILAVAPDFKRLRTVGRRTVIAYIAVLIAAAYVGLDFAANRDWPDLHDLAEWAFGGAAKAIALSVKSG